MKNQKKLIMVIIISIITILVSASYLFLNKNMDKELKIGNTMNSQEIIENILNIDSYEATVRVEVKSNKNTNMYIIKQQYINSNISTQEILEPSNIAGIKITKKENQLKIENTKLKLSSIFENYEYVSENILDLNSFIENYKSDIKANYEEVNEQIIMKTSIKNIIVQEKSLYINKNTGLPIKMEIKDTNKNNEVYILYNEVKINSKTI